ncbi:type II toxin-antitoxin system YafQ family toxin [Pelistega ratti]|uniref:type II toxin-antitoxin system RelE/ParE family toxin n=1 Tax=Pelistega ratti TaxID=2652177 RepID=UPI00135B9060|nr:type II toxin-antitoxin system YafQ family toxin [Pelistega ratti]
MIKAIAQSKTLTIAYTKDFKKDFDKLSLKQVLSTEFTEVMYHLQHGLPLPEKYRDHPLKGKMKAYRDCHIQNDLVLIYSIKDGVLTLIRLNSHSEIFN